MKGTPRALGRVSKRLIFSYVLDWIVILGIAAVGGGFDKISPNKRPFSLTDPNISFPYTEHEKVTNATLISVALIAPGIIIFLISIFLIPGPTVDRRTPRALIWRRKGWEWFTGWSGLGLSLALTFLVTDGLKNLFGKPRPDLLSRCNPDLANAAKYAIGGISAEAPGTITLVTWEICRGNGSDLSDGFRSFPSGHCSFAFAGLTYLTLFLCSKFSIAIPFLAPRPHGQDDAAVAAFGDQHSRLPNQHNTSSSYSDGRRLSPQKPDTRSIVPLRNQAAAPPNFLLVIAVIPVATAAYIASTRYSDFRHHGFDIIFGTLIGIVFAWFGFRWYHLPIRQGAGWAWGARTRDRAFGIRVGVGSYIGREGWTSTSTPTTAASNEDVDLERADGFQPMDVLGPGQRDTPERGAQVDGSTSMSSPPGRP
ncbi:MAG: hypothetical protein M4579_001041 [Chaenotheca gracillima]|nr:MAG: hypothetical protein M4579_001041 [Chaenotheca gracillima]